MHSPNLPFKKTRSPRELALAMHGVLNFMVTPFHASLKLNAEGLQENIRYHAAAGAQDMTILVGGGMGELLSLDIDEHRLVAEAAVAGAEGKMPVVVGVRGGYRLALRMARNVEQAGADAMFLLAPPYGSETAEGAYQYMSDIAKSVSIGVLVSMVSGLSGAIESYWPDLIRRLTDLPNVVGFEDSSGDVLIAQALGKQILDRFVWVARGEGHALRALPAGARAYTGAVATLVPNACREFWKQGISGNIDAMNEVYKSRITPLAQLRGLKPGYRASAVKVALEALGRAGGTVRPPETPVTAEDRERIVEITRKHAEV
ncbi:MAG: hypothetical protein EXQ58_03905 [Acidobacteria bacterium]|nr:hypothetical protein [Acidobacteriota bacterium]